MLWDIGQAVGRLTPQSTVVIGRSLHEKMVSDSNSESDIRANPISHERQKTFSADRVAETEQDLRRRCRDPLCAVTSRTRGTKFE
jgi:hypothetical protein